MESARQEFRLPTAPEMRSFDGTGAAARWLSQLNGNALDASLVIQAIDIGLLGEAAVFMDSSDRLREIVNLAKADHAGLEQGRYVYENLLLDFVELGHVLRSRDSRPDH